MDAAEPFCRERELTNGLTEESGETNSALTAAASELASGGHLGPERHAAARQRRRRLAAAAKERARRLEERTVARRHLYGVYLR
jgi:hypothetical protein